MPIIKSAKKALRQSIKRRRINLKHKKDIKRITKIAKKEVKNKNKEKIFNLIPLAYKAYDKAAKTGAIKKNTASRKKARLMKVVNALN